MTDGEYIFSYLFKNGYELIKNKSLKRDKTFTCLISDTGQFYSIEIYFHVTKTKVNKVTIWDSMKVLNFSVDKIAEDFDLPIRKLKIDYKAKREIGHILTKEEIDYIRNDVTIMAMAMDYMYNEGLDKMTIGSDALNYYKKHTKYFKNYFPILPYEIDSDIRESYRGGFTYLNDSYREKEVGEGLVLDVNSLYPSVLVNELLPFGDPVFFEGKYKDDNLYKLYVQKFTCIFELKDNKIPTIELKNNLSFMPNEYLKSSKGEPVTLTLTNVDLELFFMQYNVTHIIYHSGWKFKCIKGLFTDYVNYWTERKIQAKKDGNKVIYTISKLLLNSLYGKMGLSCVTRSKWPYIDFEGVVKYEISEKEMRKPIYIPVATFVTSYARRKTILTSQAVKDYSLNKYGKDLYCYSDTDSLHVCMTNEEELKQFVDIDDYRLGAWKIESRFTRGKFIRQKCYIEENEIDEKQFNKMKEKKKNVYLKDDKYYMLNTTIAGMPKNLGRYLNFDNFNIGLTLNASDTTKEHKLTFKHVKGGVLLVDTDFTIK